MELPDTLMHTARDLRPHSPRPAAWRALIGAAIILFSRRMLRLKNVAGLRMDQHLQRADPKGGWITHISIPSNETKNDRVISLPIAPDIARLLEVWITDFRPIIAAPDCVYLFPGNRTGNRSITPQALSFAVKRATKNFAGVALSPHQFRHLGAHTFLEEHPGHYEEVRRQLGHASVTTTTRYYCGGESASAARRFDEVILNRRQSLRRKPAAKKPARQPHQPKKGGR
jgi:integrase